ncbi:hypothetical protein BDN72DRAFT_871117 [Pluteus cervinus]|uniref:Uncharacterized protein n=1 Tax=Pluteus cervinus TaxID=181527 RepID=A0ACD3AQ03_9AGAR|nr:hypothetical protein BDN72DRAFT_871117 [Pluteus cervinus]
MHKVRVIFRDGDERLHPFMKSWLDLIDNDPQANMHFTNMFLEFPENAKGSLIDQGITDYRWLIRVLDLVAREAPEYIHNGPELTSVPISLVLDYFMNTPGGMNAFMYDKINAYIYKTLESWGNYLTTTESAGVLNEGPRGWFSEDAIAMFDKRAGTPFEEMYLCDRSLPHWGFDSWDHFFTRPLCPDARPTDRNSNHIISPCESTTFRLAHDVKATDTFWLKKEIPLFSYPYSLVHMFKHDNKYVKAFEGGTVYQAYLSPFDYHRWHSPVDIIPSTYRAAVSGSGDSNGADAIVYSQSFLTAVAARAVFYIRSTSPDIGLLAFMAIGMVEVSTCHVTIREGDHIERGDELGMFHFGGSSQCMVFNKETELTWLQGLVDEGGNLVQDKMVYVNSGIAIAKRVGTVESID